MADPIIRLCKDCRHAALVEQPAEGMVWTCSHSSASFLPDPDYVTGKPRQAIQLPCRLARQGWEPRYCGPEGKYWEARL
jgi:hypothetical protein